ncbi:MAG: bL17 family ribosomal protein [Pseudomonadales bacterium]
MLRNLASSLFLTERDAELDDNAPKVKGRVITTLHKAKEVRPLVERCITIARRSLAHQAAAEEFESSDERGTDAWKSWRQSDQWQQWNARIAPVVAARRRALILLGDKQAVQLLFKEIAPRFVERPGGYTRILKLASPRLGDAGPRAVLEFVGVHDRVRTELTRPAFDDLDEVSVNDEAEEASGDSAVDEEASTREVEASDDAAGAPGADEQSTDADKEKG